MLEVVGSMLKLNQRQGRFVLKLHRHSGEVTFKVCTILIPCRKVLIFFITCHHQTLGQGVKIPSKQCDHFSYGQNFLADYSHPLCRSVQHHQLLLSFRRNQIYFLPAAIAESHRGCVCAATTRPSISSLLKNE